MDKNLSSASNELPEFLIDDGKLISYNGDKKHIKIPAGVIEIGKGVFKGSSIESVSFEGDSLQKIDEEAFCDCKNLEGVELPKGLTAIFDRAFGGCSALRYVYIPSSVLHVSRQAFLGLTRDLVIVGEEGSEAQALAKQNGYLFETSLDDVKNVENTSRESSSALSVKEFDVFGQKIKCSSAIAKYIEIKKHYEALEQELMEKLRGSIPKKFDNTKTAIGIGDCLKVDFDKAREDAVERLKKNGVATTKERLSIYVASPFLSLTKAYTALANTMAALCEEAEKKIKTEWKILHLEAESKVTGTSSIYRYSHSLEGLIADMEDIKVRSRQYQAANAEAREQLDKFTDELVSKQNQKIEPFINDMKKAIEEQCPAFVKGLLESELDLLTAEGIINADIADGIDLKKAEEFSKRVDFTKDEDAIKTAIALSLLFCPLNPPLIKEAIERGITCDGLEALVEHLNMKNDFDAIDEEARRVKQKEFRYSLAWQKGMETLVAVENSTICTESEKIEIFNDFGKKNNFELAKFLRELPQDFTNIEENVEKWMNSVVTPTEWAVYQKYNVSPFGIEWSPAEKWIHDGSDTTFTPSVDREEFKKWLVNRVKEILAYRQEKDKIYNQAVEQMATGKLNDLCEAKKTLEELSDVFLDTYRSQYSKVSSRLVDVEYAIKSAKKKKIAITISIISAICIIPILVTLLIFTLSSGLSYGTMASGEYGVTDTTIGKSTYEIPSEHDGKEVTVVHLDAFKGRNVKNLYIPATVKKIYLPTESSNKMKIENVHFESAYAFLNIEFVFGDGNIRWCENVYINGKRM